MKRFYSLFCILIVIVFLAGTMIACDGVIPDFTRENNPLETIEINDVSDSETNNTNDISDNNQNSQNNDELGNNDVSDSETNNTNDNSDNNQNSQNNDELGNEDKTSSTPVFFAPTTDLYIGEYANKQIDIEAINNSNSISSASERAATMIINASYNNIYINQFFYKATVNIQSTEHSNRLAVAEYYRAKNGVNMFYETLAYTGTINIGTARIDYVDQRLTSTCYVTYDTTTKEWGASFQDVERPQRNDGKELNLPDATPYNIFSWYDFPLDLGGMKSYDYTSTEGRKEEIDFSLIDEKSVKIEEMTDADGVAFYRVSFKAIIDKAQASKETIDRFSVAFNNLKNITFSELNFEIDIWKDAGVFRKIGFDARVTASMGKDRGEFEIDKLLAFSYDDHDCSVAEHIYKFAEQYTNKWITKFSDKNRAQLEADIAALAKKMATTPTDKTPEE